MVTTFGCEGSGPRKAFPQVILKERRWEVGNSLCILSFVEDLKCGFEVISVC